jgi:hypothetical protein
MERYEPRSGLGWIHFSDTDRQKVMQVLDLLKPQGTVDELGVGVVRDALADELFPGMTTLMTRAKYFILVPRMIQEFIRERPTGIGAAEFLRLQENWAMNELGRVHEYKDTARVIGVTFAKRNRDLPKKRWQELARKPSEMYWNGVRTYGIYTGQLSLANQLDQLDRRPGRSLSGFNGAEETGDDQDTELDEHRQLFRLPDKQAWRTDLRMDLTPSEAEFLHERITNTHGDRLIGLVLKNPEWRAQFSRGKSFSQLCDMPFVRSLPSKVRSALYIARHFWTIMEGAHIRYNILLQRHAGSPEGRQEREADWLEWATAMRRFDWAGYNEQDLWAIVVRNGRLPGRTSEFIRLWTELVRDQITDTEKMDDLVATQEQRNKGKRSKLLSDINEGIRYTGWVGIGGMDYRFGQVRNIVEDIDKGLN